MGKNVGEKTSFDHSINQQTFPGMQGVISFTHFLSNLFKQINVETAYRYTITYVNLYFAFI